MVAPARAATNPMEQQRQKTPVLSISAQDADHFAYNKNLDALGLSQPVNSTRVTVSVRVAVGVLTQVSVLDRVTVSGASDI